MSSKRMVSALALMALLALTASACVGYGYGPDVGVRVGFGPPGFRTEVAVGSPGPGYIWVPGYYDWLGADYGWVEGRWILPPHAHAVWVAPRYEHRRGGWFYRHGHWR
ncbi:MAG TPA: hypothetical protein VFE33_06590 [Thermoanaerobaculia bacterium]|nr:hypothetical protein [Thermoanaerobaculia bacterium]